MTLTGLDNPVCGQCSYELTNDKVERLDNTVSFKPQNREGGIEVYKYNLHTTLRETLPPPSSSRKVL